MGEGNGFPGERSIIRPFSLPDERGRLLELSSFRQRRNLVLLFLRSPVPAAEALLRELAACTSALAAEEAVVLTVLHGGKEQARQLRKQLRLPFPVLADEAGGVVRGHTATASIYITDRFREVYAVCHQDNLFSRDEVLEWLAHINRQCPE